MMYNPWGTNNYKGAVPNTKAINGPNGGQFTMKLEEFMDSYSAVTINYVMPNYKVASMNLATDKLSALDVKVSSPGKFWVSMFWPTARMVAPCKYLNPDGFLEGAPAAGGAVASKQLDRMSNGEALSSEFANAKGGTYDVLAIETFRKSASWIKAMQVSVYAPVKAVIAASTEKTENVALKMFGPANGGKPCEGITVAGAGYMSLDASKLVAGVPTYWTGDGKKFMYYAASEQKWNSVGASSLEKVQGGEMWSSAKFDTSALKCGCEDDSKGVAGFGESIPCNDATAAKHKYGNVQCHGQSDSGTVQSFCPKTCHVCPGQAPAVTTTTAKPKTSFPDGPSCKDSTSFKGPPGYNNACSGWVGYNCDLDDASKAAQLKSNCPKACRLCSACVDDASYKDKDHKMACSQWKGYTCPDAETQKKCPNACSTCTK